MAIHYKSISIEFRYNDTVGMTGKYQCIQTIDIHSVNSTLECENAVPLGLTFFLLLRKIQQLANIMYTYS